MPFWKKAPVKQGSGDSGSNGVNGDGGKPKEKVDYKARLQHKQYIVSMIYEFRTSLGDVIIVTCIYFLYNNDNNAFHRLKKVQSRYTISVNVD